MGSSESQFRDVQLRVGEKLGRLEDQTEHFTESMELLFQQIVTSNQDKSDQNIYGKSPLKRTHNHDADVDTVEGFKKSHLNAANKEVGNSGSTVKSGVLNNRKSLDQSVKAFSFQIDQLHKKVEESRATQLATVVERLRDIEDKVEVQCQNYFNAKNGKNVEEVLKVN